MPSYPSLSLRSALSRRTLAVLAALLLTVAACGANGGTDGDVDPDPAAATTTPDATAAEADAAAFPVTVGTDPAVEITARPERIVSLSPTATEMLFAIGAGDQVVAVDEYSYYPPEAPVTDLSGFQPNVEAIAGYDPDLVVASSDPGELVDSLNALDIAVLIHPSATTLDDAFEQIEQLGLATGNTTGAAELVATMQAEIDEIVASVDLPDSPLTYYHELDPSFYSVTGSTFIGHVYSLLGLTSIADAAEETSGPYPQLSPEFIIEADPDFIFLADAACCDVTPEVVAERPGWDTITAVQEGNIVVLDEDIASRWGPRIVDLLRDVAEAVAAHSPAA